ncbi:GAF domain-containing sensor histidine kinase [Chloroflexota bacterium]
MFLKRVKGILESKWLPWGVLGVLLTFFIGSEVLKTFGYPVSNNNNIFIGVSVFLILLIFLLLANRISSLRSQRDKLQQELSETDRTVEVAYERVNSIFKVNQAFVEARDENDVMEMVLETLVELVKAKGASFVPLDEHGQPKTTLMHGEMPSPVAEAWLEHLASPRVRESCNKCDTHDLIETPGSCPLLLGPFANSVGLLCLTIKRGNWEYGVLNIFLQDDDGLDEKTRTFLKALVEEIALGLEGIRLRRRELLAIQQMQSIQEKTNLDSILLEFLRNTQHTFEAEFGQAIVPRRINHQKNLNLASGEVPTNADPFLRRVLQGVIESGESVLLGDVTRENNREDNIYAVIASPLLSFDNEVLGAMLVGKQKNNGFNLRHLALLQTISGQVALVIENMDHMVKLEYKTMMEERIRLAREIHDGIAQTLGFLKLHTAQMRSYFQRGEIDRAHQSVDLCYQTLSDAYLEAREAIDGLRIWPADYGLAAWFKQSSQEFEDISGLIVHIDERGADSELPPEIQAQLIRIVQEALSNIRKHANAEEVWVSCYETSDDLIIEVRDNGSGFSPEDKSGPSQHGLRGMRERAELIGADFQIISHPLDGTIVRLRFPLEDQGLLEKM